MKFWQKWRKTSVLAFWPLLAHFPVFRNMWSLDFQGRIQKSKIFFFEKMRPFSKKNLDFFLKKKKIDILRKTNTTQLCRTSSALLSHFFLTTSGTPPLKNIEKKKKVRALLLKTFFFSKMKRKTWKFLHFSRGWKYLPS